MDVAISGMAEEDDLQCREGCFQCGADFVHAVADASKRGLCGHFYINTR
jgi:hypothetical protein